MQLQKLRDFFLHLKQYRTLHFWQKFIFNFYKKIVELLQFGQ